MNETIILSVEPGSGGEEVADFMEMLVRMYTLWAEKKKYVVFSKPSLPGTVSITILGENIYDSLKGEVGTHRLVRLSPHDTQSRRYTSFAKVSIVRVDEGPGLVRSYVFHPYKKVVDHCSGVETEDIDKVLQGDLDLFINDMVF